MDRPTDYRSSRVVIILDRHLKIEFADWDAFAAWLADSLAICHALEVCRARMNPEEFAAALPVGDQLQLPME